MGTPQIAVNSIQKLLNFNDVQICAVVTQPDRPCGRGKKLTPPPVKEFALRHEIPVFQTESIRKDEKLLDKLRKIEPDFFITFAFGQILTQEVLDIPKFATINLHASLLPKYRGANPIQRAIFNGDEETGITTMRLSSYMILLWTLDWSRWLRGLLSGSIVTAVRICLWLLEGLTPWMLMRPNGWERFVWKNGCRVLFPAICI